jgi:hypothetical protein
MVEVSIPWDFRNPQINLAKSGRIPNHKLLPGPIFMIWSLPKQLRAKVSGVRKSRNWFALRSCWLHVQNHNIACILKSRRAEGTSLLRWRPHRANYKSIILRLSTWCPSISPSLTKTKFWIGKQLPSRPIIGYLFRLKITKTTISSFM